MEFFFSDTVVVSCLSTIRSIIFFTGYISICPCTFNAMNIRITPYTALVRQGEEFFGKQIAVRIIFVDNFVNSIAICDFITIRVKIIFENFRDFYT